MDLTALLALLASVYVMVSIPLYAILADTIIGVFISLKEGNFDITVFPKFLAKNVLPYVGSLLIFAFLAQSTGDGNLIALFDVCVVGVTAKFGWEAINEKILGYFKGTYVAAVVKEG